MVVSSQEVYKRLMLRSPDPNLLNFEVLAENTRLPDGNLDEEKLKQLLRLIRPDRDGKSLQRQLSCFIVLGVSNARTLCSRQSIVARFCKKR
jgi:hypothetical protein